MEVILLERIEKLGQMGDVVNVKTGYARNFLLPNNKALRATEENRAHFDNQRARLEADNLAQRTEAEAVGSKLDGQSVVLVRQAGDAGQLYGSVSGRDIALAITELGFTVSRSQVILERPIKAIGIHSVRIVLHAEVSVSVNVNVARTREEAGIQAKTGSAVLSMEQQDATAAANAAATAQQEVFEEGAMPEEDLSEGVEALTSENEAANDQQAMDGETDNTETKKGESSPASSE